jgi:hypothetical protein
MASWKAVILGNELLRHFTGTVGYRRRVLVLERPAAKS